MSLQCKHAKCIFFLCYFFKIHLSISSLNQFFYYTRRFAATCISLKHQRSVAFFMLFTSFCLRKHEGGIQFVSLKKDVLQRLQTRTYLVCLDVSSVFFPVCFTNLQHILSHLPGVSPPSSKDLNLA